MCSSPWRNIPRTHESLRRTHGLRFVILVLCLTAAKSLNRMSGVIKVKIAIWASLIANFCLCVLQCKLDPTLCHLPPRSLSYGGILVYATVTSGSLSILATGIDSVFDIGSNLLLFYIHRKSSRLDHNKWPVGGSRLETIGDIAYGVYSSSSTSRPYHGTKYLAGFL